MYISRIIFLFYIMNYHINHNGQFGNNYRIHVCIVKKQNWINQVSLSRGTTIRVKIEFHSGQQRVSGDITAAIETRPFTGCLMLVWMFYVDIVIQRVVFYWIQSPTRLCIPLGLQYFSIKNIMESTVVANLKTN